MLSKWVDGHHWTYAYRSLSALSNICQAAGSYTWHIVVDRSIDCSTGVCTWSDVESKYIYTRWFEYVERIQCIAYKIVNWSIKCPCIDMQRLRVSSCNYALLLLLMLRWWRKGIVFRLFVIENRERWAAIEGREERKCRHGACVTSRISQLTKYVNYFSLYVPLINRHSSFVFPF